MTVKKITSLKELYIEDIERSINISSYADRLLNRFTSDILHKENNINFDKTNPSDIGTLFFISETLRTSENPDHFEALRVFLDEKVKSKDRLFNNFTLSLHEPNKELLKCHEKLFKLVDENSEFYKIIIASHIAQQAFIFSEIKLLCEMYEYINKSDHSLKSVKFYTLGLVGMLAGNWNMQETLYTTLLMFPTESVWLNKTFKYLSNQRRMNK